MAFPTDPLDVRVELDVGGWTVVTAETYLRDPISIERGRKDEGARADPSSSRIQFNNREGKYSPRNPNSEHFGVLGRNTPVRVSVPASATYLTLTGATGTGATCPDAAALGITGDIDIRIDLTLLSWRAYQDLAGKYVTSGDQRSWAVQLQADGKPSIVWTSDGTSGTLISAVSTAVLPVPAGRRQAVRVTLDVDNGAAGNTVTFYYADTIDGTWTQLGDSVVTTGTTSIFDGTASVEVGDIASLASTVVGSGFATTEPPTGRAHAFQLLSGIDGTIVADPDFTIQTAGASSFADTAAAPNTWTIAADSDLLDREYRLHHEVSSWPASWDVSGNDVWTTVEAAGIMRRLGQGAAPLNSVLYRSLITLTDDPPVAYWPCEDADGAASLASALPSGRPMTITGSPSLGGSSAFVASDALPTLGNSTWAGQVPTYTTTGETQIRFLLAIPAAGTTDNAVICRVTTTGTCRRWDLAYDSASSGGLSLTGYDSDGVQLFTSGVSAPYNETLLRVSIELVEDGSDIDWTWQTTEVGSPDGGGLAGTLSGRTVGRVTSVVIDPTGDMDDVTVGHISVHTAVTSILDLTDELAGWDGEAAGRRIERLCQEEGVAFRRGGNLDDTEAMGPQNIATVLELIGAAVDADGGILSEPPDLLGLAYRPRTSLYNQPVGLALDYTADGEVAPPLEPVDDDQAVRNEIVVKRDGGSSARVTLESGALSTLAPPDGIGRYDEEVTRSLHNDDQPAQHAGWLLHLGTWDETRYPTVHVDLAAGPHLADEAVALDIGDRLQIANPPSWLPPDTIDLLEQGYSERIGLYDWDLTFNCSPAGPWSVAHVEDVVYGWADTSGTELAAPATNVDTSVTVTVTDGPLWVEGSIAYTGATATGQGTSVDPDYLVCTDADAADITVGDDVRLFDSSGELKEFTIFTVNAKPSAFGFTNCEFTPDAAAVTEAGDQLRVLVATGSATDFPFPVRVGGEVWSVTGIAGTTSPQTFTVERSVNGVIKAQTAGTDVRLAYPAITAL